MCQISLSWARFELKFVSTLWRVICSGLSDCSVSFTAQMLIPCPHTPFDFSKLWRNTLCRSVISLQFSLSWPSLLVNSLHAVTLSLVKLSMLNSEPAFAIILESQITNLKICGSLSRRKYYACVACLAGWREKHSWATSSHLGWLTSHLRRGRLCHSLSVLEKHVAEGRVASESELCPVQ